MWISEKKFYEMQEERYRTGYNHAVELFNKEQSKNAKTKITSKTIGNIYVKDDISSVYSGMYADKFILLTAHNGKRQVVFTDDIIDVEEI